MVTRTDHEHIVQPCRKHGALSVLHRHDRKGSVVSLNVHHLTHSPSIAAARKHNHGAGLKLVNLCHFARRNVQSHAVVDFHVGIGVTQGASVVGDGHRNLFARDKHLGDAAQFGLGVLAGETVQHESALSIEQETESIAALLEFDHVHKTGGEIVIRADLAVYLDATLHADLHALLVGEGVLKAISEDDTEGNAHALFVGTWGRLGGPDSRHLAEVPMVGRIETLEMFLGSACHLELVLISSISGVCCCW